VVEEPVTILLTLENDDEEDSGTCTPYGEAQATDESSPKQMNTMYSRLHTFIIVRPVRCSVGCLCG